MQNNPISLSDWKQSEVSNQNCLYGYSYKSKIYLPYAEITEIKTMGKTGRIGIKGFAENKDKLFIQLYKEHISNAVEKGWITL